MYYLISTLLHSQWLLEIQVFYYQNITKVAEEKKKREFLLHAKKRNKGLYYYEMYTLYKTMKFTVSATQQ